MTPTGALDRQAYSDCRMESTKYRLLIAGHQLSLFTEDIAAFPLFITKFHYAIILLLTHFFFLFIRKNAVY